MSRLTRDIQSIEDLTDKLQYIEQYIRREQQIKEYHLQQHITRRRGRDRLTSSQDKDKIIVSNLDNIDKE